jgi:hypothetical protein
VKNQSNWRGTLEFSVDTDRLEEHNDGNPDLALTETVTKWDGIDLAKAVRFRIVDLAEGALYETENTG